MTPPVVIETYFPLSVNARTYAPVWALGGTVLRLPRLSDAVVPAVMVVPETMAVPEVMVVPVVKLPVSVTLPVDVPSRDTYPRTSMFVPSETMMILDRRATTTLLPAPAEANVTVQGPPVASVVEL